jgi:hypothetical protein
MRAQREGDISQRHGGKVARGRYVAGWPLKERDRPLLLRQTRLQRWQKSWYQKARGQFGLFMLREFPTVLEGRFQTPIEGAIYVDLIDRLRTQGAIRRAESG